MKKLRQLGGSGSNCRLSCDTQASKIYLCSAGFHKAIVTRNTKTYFIDGKSHDFIEWMIYEYLGSTAYDEKNEIEDWQKHFKETLQISSIMNMRTSLHNIIQSSNYSQISEKDIREYIKREYEADEDVKSKFIYILNNKVFTDGIVGYILQENRRNDARLNDHQIMEGVIIQRDLTVVMGIEQHIGENIGKNISEFEALQSVLNNKTYGKYRKYLIDLGKKLSSNIHNDATDAADFENIYDLLLQDYPDEVKPLQYYNDWIISDKSTASRNPAVTLHLLENKWTVNELCDFKPNGDIHMYMYDLSKKYLEDHPYYWFIKSHVPSCSKDSDKEANCITYANFIWNEVCEKDSKKDLGDKVKFNIETKIIGGLICAVLIISGTLAVLYK